MRFFCRVSLLWLAVWRKSERVTAGEGLSTDVDGGLLGDDLVGQGVERGEVQGRIHVGQQKVYLLYGG